MILLDDLLTAAGGKSCHAVVSHADFLSLRLQAETRNVMVRPVPSRQLGSVQRPGAIWIRNVKVLDEGAT